MKLCIVTLCLWASLVYAVSNRPINCTSVGDPHITPFPGGRTDLYSPGVQIPGDFVLARFCGTIVTESHHPYPANPVVYVNYRLAITEGGNTIVVSFDSVTINGAPTTITVPVTVGTLTITRISYAYYSISGLHGIVTAQGVSDQYMNLQVTITDGCVPDGGLCAPYCGTHSRNCTTTTTNTTAFILSWQEYFGEAPFGYATPADWAAANPSNYTTSQGNFKTENQKLQATATQNCAPITQGQVAQQCQPVLNAAAYSRACLDDAIATQNAAWAASIVDDFNRACAARLDQGAQLVLPTSAASSTAAGPGIQPRVPNQTAAGTFVITARDALGKQRTVGGDVFTVVSVPPALVFTTVDEGNGLYKVSYTPKAGAYAISVQLAGNDIVGSTFYITIG